MNAVLRKIVNLTIHRYRSDQEAVGGNAPPGQHAVTFHSDVLCPSRVVPVFFGRLVARKSSKRLNRSRKRQNSAGG